MIPMEHAPTITVVCTATGCANEGVAIDLPNDGIQVACGGGCGNILAEAADWYEPPALPDPVNEVAEKLANMDEDQRAALIALLAGHTAQ